MNLVNLNAMYGGAPYGAVSSEGEDANLSACAYCRLRSDQLEDGPRTSATQADTCKNTARAFARRHLHSLYRETLPDYKQPTSDWMRDFSRKTLCNIWQNYKETRA